MGDTGPNGRATFVASEGATCAPMGPPRLGAQTRPEQRPKQPQQTAVARTTTTGGVRAECGGEAAGATGGVGAERAAAQGAGSTQAECNDATSGATGGSRTRRSNSRGSRGRQKVAEPQTEQPPEEAGNAAEERPEKRPEDAEQKAAEQPRPRDEPEQNVGPSADGGGAGGLCAIAG